MLSTRIVEADPADNLVNKIIYSFSVKHWVIFWFPLLYSTGSLGDTPDHCPQYQVFCSNLSTTMGRTKEMANLHQAGMGLPPQQEAW